MTKEKMLTLIDWENVMKAPRYSGGHSEIMNSIFGKNAEVIAYHQDDDYQGELIYAYYFPDGTIAFISDYFGSCSGCDSWDDASNEDAMNMITSLVSSSRLCKTFTDAISFCETGCKEAEQFSHGRAEYLKDKLIECKQNKLNLIKEL